MGGTPPDDLDAGDPYASPGRPQQGGFAPPGATAAAGPVLGPPFGPPPSPPAGYGPPPPQHSTAYAPPSGPYPQQYGPQYGEHQPYGHLYGQPQPGPYGGPGYAATYGPPAVQGWGPTPGWYGPSQHPGSALLTAAAKLRAAAVLLWALQLAWLLFVGGGAALLSTGARVDDVYATSAALDAGDALTGLAALLYLGLGTAVWALAALWTSYVDRACSTAGNGVLGRASWAWWGLFVPFAGLVLPLLAYREAAAYVVAGERVGGPGQGRGPWWRQERVPGLLTAWWSLWAAAAVGLFLAVSTTDDPSTSGALFLLTGLLGSASSLCGAMVLRRLARSTALCSSASWG